MNALEELGRKWKQKDDGLVYQLKVKAEDSVLRFRRGGGLKCLMVDVRVLRNT